MSQLLELESQMVVSHLMQMLRTKLLWDGSSDCGAISSLHYGQTMAALSQAPAVKAHFLFQQVLCGADSPQVSAR